MTRAEDLLQKARTLIKRQGAEIERLTKELDDAQSLRVKELAALEQNHADEVEKLKKQIEELKKKKRTTRRRKTKETSQDDSTDE